MAENNFNKYICRTKVSDIPLDVFLFMFSYSILSLNFPRVKLLLLHLAETADHI